MVKADLVVKTLQGLHLGPANIIANAAEDFKSKIQFQSDSMTINAKSIISIVSGCFPYNAVLTCICEGPDEKKALEKMKELFATDLGNVKVSKIKTEQSLE